MDMYMSVYCCCLHVICLLCSDRLEKWLSIQCWVY